MFKHVFKGYTLEKKSQNIFANSFISEKKLSLLSSGGGGPLADMCSKNTRVYFYMYLLTKR